MSISRLLPYNFRIISGSEKVRQKRYFNELENHIITQSLGVFDAFSFISSLLIFVFQLIFILILISISIIFHFITFRI